ncbi:MAG: hypothetical protein J6B75_04410 [Ruminococcus sp.]|nr:hypothetical protein [Ruminococcus sp.]
MDELGDIFDLIFNNEFIKAFLSDSESQKRLNISVISSICFELADISDEECTSEFRLACANKILNQCSQMMKFSEIFTIFSEILSENEPMTDTIDISEFLSEFTNECRTYLKGTCEISCKPGEMAVTETMKKLLEFCMIMYVRKSVLIGAESISFTHTLESEYIVIHAKIEKFGTAAETENMPETVTFDYADGIISSAVKKLNGKYTSDDKEMKLYIPFKNSGSSVLKSPPKTYGKPVFNILKIMLSDLGDITII